MLRVATTVTRLAIIAISLSLIAGVKATTQPIAAIDITIDEWAVPTDSFPHDPAVAPDGSI